jgi:hypothetical protein
MKNFALVGVFLIFGSFGPWAYGATSDADRDRVDLTIKLEVDGKLVFEKRVSPRFGEKRTLSKTLYGDKTEYELEVLPSRYNDNAAMIETTITKISDLGPSKPRSAVVVATPKIVTLNKIDASVETTAKHLKYKLSILPAFQNL